MQKLQINKVTLSGFPFQEGNIKYFEYLKSLINKHKNIFDLKKISLKCQINESNFFSKFKTEEFYFLITNFFQDLFACFNTKSKTVKNALIVNFSKLEFSYSLNELYFYIFCLSQQKDIFESLNFIKIKYLYSKHTVFKHLNIENYKKFVKEFLAIKNFSQYKYQNDEHFLKIFSKANYNNIQISGEISKKNNSNNNCPLSAAKHFGNKFDLLIKDTNDIKEMELEEEYYSNEGKDSNSSYEFKNYELESDKKSAENLKVVYDNDENALDEELYDKQQKLDLVNINDKEQIKKYRTDYRYQPKILEKENESFDNYIDKSCSFDDFDERLIFNDDNENKLSKVYKNSDVNNLKEKKKNRNFKDNYKNNISQVDYKTNDLSDNVSSNKYFYDNSSNNNNNKCINKENGDFNLNNNLKENLKFHKDQNELIYIPINNNKNEHKNEEEDYNAIDNLYDEFDKMQNKNLPSEQQANINEKSDSNPNFEYFEIKKYSKLFEKIYFKIKSALKTKKGIIKLSKPMKSQINLNNLLNLDLRFDNKLTKYNPNSARKFLGSFPPCLMSIKFDFHTYDSNLVNEILNNITLNDLNQIKKLHFTFDHLNLLDTIYQSEYQSIKFISNNNNSSNNLSDGHLNEIDVSSLMKTFIKILNKNKNLKEFYFTCSRYLLKNELNNQDYHDEDRFTYDFSSMKFGKNIKIDLFFTNSMLLEFLANKFLKEKPLIDIEIEFSAVPFEYDDQNLDCLKSIYFPKHFEEKQNKIQNSKSENDNNKILYSINNYDYQYQIDNETKGNLNTFNINDLDKSNKLILQLNYINFINFLYYFKEFEKNLSLGWNSEINEWFMGSLKKIKFKNFEQPILTLLNEDDNCKSFFTKIKHIEKLILIYSPESKEGVLASRDFSSLISLFCKNQIEETSNNALCIKPTFKSFENNSNSCNLSVLKFEKLMKIKLKCLGKEENGFIQELFAYLIKNQIKDLKKIIIEANMDYENLENCLINLIKNPDCFNKLGCLLLKSKMLSGFTELFDKYHNEIYNIYKSMIVCDIINTYV